MYGCDVATAGRYYRLPVDVCAFYFLSMFVFLHCTKTQPAVYFYATTCLVTHLKFSHMWCVKKGWSKQEKCLYQNEQVLHWNNWIHLPFPFRCWLRTFHTDFAHHMRIHWAVIMKSLCRIHRLSECFSVLQVRWNKVSISCCDIVYAVVSIYLFRKDKSVKNRWRIDL